MSFRPSASILLVFATFIGTALSSATAAGSPPVLIGAVYDEHGQTVRNADICLYRVDFQTIDASKKYRYPQGAVRCRKTDRAGSYSLQLPDREPYLLLARQKSSWVMRPVVFSPGADTIYRKDTLYRTGSLRFQVNAEGRQDHRAIAALTGTPFMFTADTAGVFTVSDVPAGTYEAVIKSIHRGHRAVVCSLRIRSGQSDLFPGTLVIPRESAAMLPGKKMTIGAASAAPFAASSVETTRPESAPEASVRTAADTPALPRPVPPAVHKPPSVKAPADTFIGIFDTLTLAGMAVDDGEVVAMEWDIGARGEFIRTDDGRILLPPFKAPVKRMPCIFRATDNDGLSSTDTTAVWAGLLWKSITPPSRLLGRNGHSFLSFNDELFIVGGKRSDVWSSSDGSSWTLLTDEAPFGKLFGHSTVAFNDRLWVIGGKTGPETFNGAIWSSASGVKWEREATMPFPRRLYHGAVVFRGKMWVIGGLSDSENEPILNDVWSSTDGRNWSLVVEHAPFEERYGHGCTVFNGCIVVTGGFNDAVGKRKSYNDVWKTCNGTDWTCVTPSAPFSKELYHSAIEFDNRLWVIGGYEKEGESERFTDVLFTVDGTEWINLTPERKAVERAFCAAVVFRNRILVSPSDSHRIWIVR